MEIVYKAANTLLKCSSATDTKIDIPTNAEIHYTGLPSMYEIDSFNMIFVSFEIRHLLLCRPNVVFNMQIVTVTYTQKLLWNLLFSTLGKITYTSVNH